MGYRLMGFVLSMTAASFSLNFIVPPSLSGGASGPWTLSFTLDQATDVAVSIVNPADSSIVRHLAAGVLGADAPAPLQRNSLAQQIPWDGLDDLGRPVSRPETMRARVRAGMSPRLTNLVGDNPHEFSRRIEGLAVINNELYVYGATGSLYFSGGASTGQAITTVRVYDSTGQFKRTLFPFAPDMPVDSIKYYGIVRLPDGSYTPKINLVHVPVLGRSLLTNTETKMIAGALPGQLLMFNFNSFQFVSASGAIRDSLATRISPAPNGSTIGALFCAFSHNPRYLYFSGMYEAAASGSLMSATYDSFNTYSRKPVVYPDGRVWKMDVQTGSVTPWLIDTTYPRLAAQRDSMIGNSIVFSSFHGTASDDSGHVFVCDRLHGRIGVYDTQAVFLGSIPLKWPDEIIVDKKTGTIYATSRERNNGVQNAARISLYKFNGWRGVTVPACTVAVSNLLSRYRDRTHLALTRVNGRPVVWTGYLYYGVKAYADQGGRFESYREFPMTVTGFDHIDVDRRTETVFFTNSYCGLFKIKDWANPEVVRCSTSFKKPLMVADPAVSWDGYLYGREGFRSADDYSGPIRRFTLDDYHAPAPFANTGKDTLVRMIVTRADAGWADRGMAVSRFGALAIVNQDNASGDRSRLQVSQYSLIGGQDTGNALQLVHPVGFQAGGVRYDLQGNFYVGLKVLAADHVIPAPYSTDKQYANSTGAVVKYPAGRSGFGVDTSGTRFGPYAAPGALKVYSPDYGSFSNDNCVCRTPRFDVDAYGRLFIPHTITQKISVIDNEGNPIVQFGGYGNNDCRGGLPGPGRTVSGPAFPFAWPVGVAVTENHIFVTDIVNSRLARIRMDYALDNIPWASNPLLADRAAETRVKSLVSMQSSPNPFYPASRISVYFPERASIRLSVLDAQGRLTKTLFSGEIRAGVTSFVWDARKEDGRPAAAGIYFYRLSAEGRVKTVKTVLAR